MHDRLQDRVHGGAGGEVLGEPLREAGELGGLLGDRPVVAEVVDDLVGVSGQAVEDAGSSFVAR
jgi:hypothetical protein